MATTYLTRTMTGSPTSNKKGTMSYWFKRSKLGVYQNLGQIGAASAGAAGAGLAADDQWIFYWEHDGSAWDMLKTNRKFRDTSGYYNVVFNWDSTLATSGDRLQLWVNGVRETDFATEVQPAQDTTCLIGSAQTYNFNAWSSTSYFDGLISHYHYIDGTAYPASTFGETDATTGEWKIKTSPSVTYGNQGYFILKDGNSVTDQSGNGNNWTVGGGTLTNTEDCPSDVFCCANALSKGASITLSNGNTTITNGASWQSVMGTLGVSKGKWYWENKVASLGTANAGITMSKQDGTTHSSVDATRIMYSSNGYVYRDALGTSTDTGTTFTTGDIIGVSLDCDSGIIKFYKNDALIDTSTNSIITNNEWCPAWGVNAGSFNVNFGNGYFSTTAISSAGTNASGIGIFEYDVPTGYTALSTKGLNS